MANILKEIPRAVINIFQYTSIHVFTDGPPKHMQRQFLCETESDNVLDFCQIKRSPIKTMAIPKLELLAILIGVRAAQFVIKQLEFENAQVILWSDSRCALHWIQNHSRLLQRFIQNRVEEIRKAKFAYRYIPSECNPANIATKAISPSDLANLTLCDNEETIDEEREQVVVTAIQEATKTSIRFVDANRFSNWSRMVRTTGIQITPYEYEFAVELLLRQAQSEGLSVEEITKRNLYYVMGLWKFKGRLQFPSSGSCISYLTYLPRHNRITEIIIQTYHEKIHHGDIPHTISELRRLYWIPKERAEVKKKAKSFKLPPMPDYHDSRTVRSKIFARIGLDYLGPVTAKTEVGMAKKSFLTALRKFVARRDCPELILSDNASQFHLIYRTIKKQESQLSNFLTSKGIIWKYITQKAPWSGGIYERIVGITKGAFRKAVDEYLNSLRERTQIEHKSPRGAITRSPSLGLINEPHIPRGMWKLAKINKLNKSSDGNVRSVQIELPFGKLLNRQVNMLYPLEAEQEDQPEDSVTELMDAKDEEPIARRTQVQQRSYELQL
ncbi:Integrase core domain containing protein [Dirofilaria immitis]|nr:Integrase core domain containing protein [Dirofilaria immitis]